MADLRDFRFWFNTSDVEMGVRMGFGIYEPETEQFFREVITPGMICWDIGAQTGFFTCLFAKLSGPEGRVYAYEPMPPSYEMILKNISENGFGPRVSVRNVACSDAHGFVPMTKTSQMFIVDHDSKDTQTVECVRLDQEENLLPELIKIDVEGHEPAVLRGLANVLERCSPLIVMELNEYWLMKNSRTSSADVVRNLNEIGFDVFLIDEMQTLVDWRELRPDMLGNCNIVARRSR